MNETAHEARPDFLERLVAKALGTEGWIAPRPQSMFEPAQESLPGEEPAWPEQTNRLIAQPQVEEKSNPSVDSPDPARIAPAKSPLEDPRGQQLEPHEPVPSSSAVRVDLPRAAAPEQERLPTAPTPTALTSPAPLRVTLPDDRASRTRTAMREVPAASMRQVVAAATPRAGEAPRSLRFESSRPTLLPTFEHGSHEPTPGKSHSSDVGEETQILLASAPRSTIESIVAPALSGSSHAQRDERRATEPEISAPVINVTIGRVEVRAMPAPAASQLRAPRGAQPLGLDEYLKRRGGR